MELHKLSYVSFTAPEMLDSYGCQIALSLPHLERVEFNSVQGISDINLVSAINSRSLKQLTLRGCANVSTPALMFLVKYGQVDDIGIVGCKHIPSSDLPTVSGLSPSKKLRIKDMPFS